MPYNTSQIAANSRVVSTRTLGDVTTYNHIRRAYRHGELIRLRHGIYSRPEALLDNMIDVESIVPGGVVCLYNAWFYHNLTTTIPPSICIAIARKRKVVTPSVLPISLYYWQENLLNFGIISVDYSGHEVRITNAERSVCDAVKYRNKIGHDLCAEVIKSYLRRSDRNIPLLSEYAQRLRVWTTLKTYLEIALAE
ncbi:MAG: hypothetical protein ACI4AM_03315 [Muribaculaceae bacterium]